MLRSNWLHILVALADSDLHGTAIAEDVLERTDGALRLWPATLYRALDELVAQGMAEELSGDQHPDGESRRKRFYRITREGRLALSEEAGRLESIAALARARLQT